MSGNADFATETVKGSDLRAGDVVRLDLQAFGYATIKKTTPDSLTFFRPFVRADASQFHDNSVFCYVGIEEFSVPFVDRDYIRVRKGAEA